MYYLVRLPEEAASPDKAMYFSKEWSVGKVVDYVAQKHKLTNENNFLHSQVESVKSVICACHTRGEYVYVSDCSYSRIRTGPTSL